MTKSGRPNLSGLFNGTTPPERSSRISDALGPPTPRPSPAVQPDEVSEPAAPEPRTVRPAERRSPVPVQAEHRWPRMPGIDPVRAVDRYFEVLQTMLDLNHAMALGWANTVSSVSARLLPRR